MTTPERPTRADLRAAVSLGTRAPSIHNTQPWRWNLRADGFELYADPERRLPIADPDGHGQLVSCGAALELARLGLLGAGWISTVDRLPEPADPTLLARVHATTDTSLDEDTVDRLAAARRRRSERRPFAPLPVAPELLERLQAAVVEQGIFLYVITRPDEQLDLAVVVSQADQAQRQDPAYLAELASWTRPDDASADGVPASAVPHLISAEPRHTEVPVRNFEVGVTGRLPVEGGQDEHPVLALIMTDDNDALAALRAGEGLARLMIEAEQAGLATNAITQALDWPVLRQRLRGLMSWLTEPQMLLRVGWKPAGPHPGVTNRRPIEEVLREPQ